MNTLFTGATPQAVNASLTNDHSLSSSELKSLTLDLDEVTRKAIDSLNEQKKTQSNKEEYVTKMRTTMSCSALNSLLFSRVNENTAKYLEISLSLSKKIV